MKHICDFCENFCGPVCVLYALCNSIVWIQELLNCTIHIFVYFNVNTLLSMLSFCLFAVIAIP